MKNELDYTFGNILDKIFSGFTLALILAGAFLFFVFNIVEQSEIARKETQQITEACYSQGMIVVDTAAGQRCADPRTLVKVK
jgi:hypothetical protein